MESGAIMGTVAVIISVITAIIGAVNHKRLRSNCCGKNMEMSVDIESTTPPRIAPAPESNRRMSFVRPPSAPTLALAAKLEADGLVPENAQKK